MYFNVVRSETRSLCCFRLEECTGPALNNFIKFVTVFAFSSNALYDVDSRDSWPFGFVAFGTSLFLIWASKVRSVLVLA